MSEDAKRTINLIKNGILPPINNSIHRRNADIEKFDKSAKFVEVNDDFGMILNCAVRYAMGRMTYMPSAVINYIIPLLNSLSDKTIYCFIKDLEDFNKDVKTGRSSWGATFDEEVWKDFFEKCKTEEKEREELNS